MLSRVWKAGAGEQSPWAPGWAARCRHRCRHYIHQHQGKTAQRPGQQCPQTDGRCWLALARMQAWLGHTRVPLFSVWLSLEPGVGHRRAPAPQEKAVRLGLRLSTVPPHPSPEPSDDLITPPAAWARGRLTFHLGPRWSRDGLDRIIFYCLPQGSFWG